ncbi:beta-L-arabinofuranosidase domain-containing protein [Paenibacillus sp. Soil724D2]|uniref:beta-L-arabinofuranosidase domain-containing protein n=1 Tax=Paenibacillus sp. (strain Soil724D2) TaxID=1736392 RepID=UPI0039E101BF
MEISVLSFNQYSLAGIPSNAEPLGGWEDVECGLRGHSVGHFLSACSKFAFADQDEGIVKRTGWNLLWMTIRAIR